MFSLGTRPLRAKSTLILPGWGERNLRVRISLGAEQETTLGFPSKMRFNKGVFCCAQSCPTLCDPMDGSPPDSSIHGILHGYCILHGYSVHQEYWCGLAFPTPGDLLNLLNSLGILLQGSNPRPLCLLHWQVDCLPLSHLGKP